MKESAHTRQRKDCRRVSDKEREKLTKGGNEINKQTRRKDREWGRNGTTEERYI
jgi:hypothetical protein